MICPGTHNDCDNPGCRHGGCQGRMPELPLFRAVGSRPTVAAATPDPLDRVTPLARAAQGGGERRRPTLGPVPDTLAAWR